MKISIVTSHTFVSIRTTNGNYTNSYSGTKSTGTFVGHLNILDKFIDDQKAKGLNTGEAMKLLSDPKTLSLLVPNWDRVIPTFAVGDTVQVIPTHRFASKYPGLGKVIQLRGKYVGIDFGYTKMGLEPIVLQLVKSNVEVELLD